MMRYVQVIKEAPEFEVLHFEEAFFRSKDLHLIPDADSRTVKSHLLDQVQRDFGERLEHALLGFGAVATQDELTYATQSLIEYVVANDTATRRDLAARTLRELWHSGAVEVRDAIPDRVLSWFNGSGPPAWKRWLAGVSNSMGRIVVFEDVTDLDDLPF